MIPTLVSFDSNHPGYHDVARKIRYAVFVSEQNVPEDLEYDAFESTSKHYLLFIGDNAAATCRWRYTSGGIKLERFAVLPQYRGKGFGEFLVRQVLREVLPEGKMVYLHAQTQVTGFYIRLGFKAFGEEFEEAGITHYFMKYEVKPDQ